MIADGLADRALLFCGTGLGFTTGVRAVTAHDLHSVQRSVLSNNALLCLGQRVIGSGSPPRALVQERLPLEFDPSSAPAPEVALTDPDTD